MATSCPVSTFLAALYALEGEIGLARLLPDYSVSSLPELSNELELLLQNWWKL